jgi:DNA repair protein RadA/Sms
LLQVLAGVAGQDLPVLLVSGEEDRGQVAARARRLGVASDAVAFAPGRDLPAVLEVARRSAPAVLAVDSIQAIRDPEAHQAVGGVSQVRACADALVGLAKSTGAAILLTGHVTKDGEVAGPRALEHAVDVILGFEGDARSGLRVVTAGKNRFGADGETCWFEMRPSGLAAIDPSSLLISDEAVPGAANALIRSGRRALAVEVQALVAPTDGPARRQATGLDPRRFQLVAAVLDRVTGLRLGRSELYGAVAGGLRLDDPAADLAIAAALVSSATGVAPPAGVAFTGELSLTGAIRPVAGLSARLAAAGACGFEAVVAAGDRGPRPGPRLVAVRQLREALTWAFERSARPSFARTA